MPQVQMNQGEAKGSRDTRRVLSQGNKLDDHPYYLYFQPPSNNSTFTLLMDSTLKSRLKLSIFDQKLHENSPHHYRSLLKIRS